MTVEDRILELFKKNRDSFLSGEDVSHSLGISRQALWKHIAKLKDMGYVVEAVPHLGYKLLRVPDKILAPEIKWNLKTKLLAREIHSYESIGSTNDIAYDLAVKGAAEGVIVTADEQTRGKGRLGRNWFSPPESGVYLSCILRPEIMPNEVPKIALLAAISVIKAIEKFCTLRALIKWPNDILISDRKVGGILTELKAEMDKADFVILGIGINVNTPRDKLPPGGTSLKSESRANANFSRIDFIKILLTALEEEYIKFKNKGFSGIRNELKSASCTLGRYVSISTKGTEHIKGKAIDIDKDGALVVKLDDGKERAFVSGDVTLIR